MVRQDDDLIEGEGSLRLHCLQCVTQDCDVLNRQRGGQVQQGASKAITGAGKEIATVLDHSFSGYLQFLLVV